MMSSKAEVGAKDQDDGSFWMPWDDFLMYFGSVDVCDPTTLNKLSEGHSECSTPERWEASDDVAERQTVNQARKLWAPLRLCAACCMIPHGVGVCSVQD
jgi:hypothetical protein